MIPKKIPPQKDLHIVKIAVELDQRQPSQIAQLIELDQRQPLTGKIQELCNNWKITDPENYSLQFGELTKFKYVTEKNRNDIKNGSVLRLRLSPAKTAADILETIRSGSIIDKSKCLDSLSQLSIDITFALEFIKEQGLRIIIGMIEDPKCDSEILKFSLKSFVELMEHGTVSWEILENTFISRNTQIICNFKKYPHECVECALSNLESIIHNTSSKYSQIEKDVTLEDLLKIIEETGSNVMQQNAIAVINAMFIKGDEQQKRKIANAFSTKQYRSVILTNVVTMINMGTEMAHQLYMLQTLTLGLLEKRMRMKMNASDQDAHEKIKELRRIAFEDFTVNNNTAAANTSITTNSSGSTGSSGAIPTTITTIDDQSSIRRPVGASGNFSQYYRKLGFKCDINPAQDFIETPPGVLALDCMIYFARNFTQHYTKIVHENSCRTDEHECPFGRTSIELVKLLCDIVHIGDMPAEQSTDFHPMFFTHDHPFEEFFCICIVILNRTWKDMRATSEDFHKVLSVVREQITRSLRTRPPSLEDFRIKIGTLTYQTITALRQQERTSREECESTASAIIALKEKIQPEIIDLIRQQRMHFLIEGTRFSKYSRGARSKDKFWYARLTPNLKAIHYGDCDEKTEPPTADDLPNKLMVIDMKQLLVGKECPHMKGRKSAVNLGFSITFDSMNHSTLDFVSPDEETFNYWTDGINALLNQDMVSKQKDEDFEMLLSMEIKLRLLDTEGIDISAEPPLIPDEPDDYDFCFES